jgi:murein DD-endopeptidase MepM/ murein hydrolase activator NlpD
MAVYPIPIYEMHNYHYGGISFAGTSKSRGDRLHAACDLVVPPGTPVYAVERGKVLQVPKTKFFQQTYTVVIRHNDFVIRYAELDKNRLVAEGDEIEEGTQIGVVGVNYKGRGMLHFEMYKGTASGPLSQPSNNDKYDYVTPGNYQRRRDLIDPTPYLDKWKLWTDWSRYSCVEPEEINYSG